MPWCPKCKSEYREGFTVCADCGSELVDEEQFLKLEEERAAAKEAQRIEFALRQAARLTAGKAEGFTMQEAECLAAEGLSGHAVQETAHYSAQEAESGGDSPGGGAFREEEASGSAMQRRADTNAAREPGTVTGMPGEQSAEDGEAFLYELEEDASQLKSAAMSGSAAAPYQDSSERASENRSSAWILMIMGSVGLVVIILGIMGVVPLHFSNPYLFYGVMAAVFVLFLVAGALSLKNARIFDKKAESENSLRDTMLAWCRENLRAQGLDGEIGVDGTESEEALYFKRFECIKAKLNYQFVNLDQGFLEKFIDDSVYDMVYERTEERL